MEPAKAPVRGSQIALGEELEVRIVQVVWGERKKERKKGGLGGLGGLGEMEGDILAQGFLGGRSVFNPGFGVGEGVWGGKVRAQTPGDVGVVGVVRDGGDVGNVVAPDDASGHDRDGRLDGDGILGRGLGGVC